MDVLTTLGRTMGFSFAAGLNLYATVAILGLASRFDWVALPPQFNVFVTLFMLSLCPNKKDRACGLGVIG